VPQNIFKIYDGRTNFWQWDTKQKLIVLDNRITEVRFSNRNMEHSKRRIVYTDKNGVRVCNVPDLLLQLPKNLIAYACIKQDDGSCSTVKAVKFAVARQPIPTDYICEQDAVVEDIMTRLELLETLMKDVEQGTQEFKKFSDYAEASMWAKENGSAGDIVVVKLDIGWVPHVIEDDKSLNAICNCDGEEIVINFDGDDADGIDEDTEETILYFDGNYTNEKTDVVQYFDGGSASGIK
jgi:hypothetical protein